MATTTLKWVGQLLAGGRYEVKAKLGEGGMGFVYRARHRKLDTDVVIKVPRPALLEDPEFVARFTREIRALVKLEHPHVVKIMDVDDHEGVPFAVMSYLAGGSLEDRQPIGPNRQPVPTPPEELGDWVEDIAAALDYVHKKGFVHRDVKPANILFDAQGHVYLSDFGVAKAAAETTKGQVDAALTGTGVVLGTPQYMAAEMALGHKYDGRVDQYALAVTVYEMLCGRVPFQGATAAAILLKQTSEQPKPVHLVCETVPKAVSDVIQKGLAKDPAQRYPSCTAFAKAVLAAVSASPNQGRAAKSMTSRVPVVSCPACSKTHRLPPTAWGKRIKCPACLHEFAAPAQPSTRTLRRPAELETGKTPQAQHDTAPHQLPPPSKELARPTPRRATSPLLFLLIGGAVLLLALFGTTAFFVVRALHQPPTDDGGETPSAQKQPRLFLGYQTITLKAGDKKYIEVTVERNGYDGPVELEVDRLPRRVSASLPKIAAERSTTQLELIAADDATEIESTARVIAKVGGTTLEDGIKITVLSGSANNRPSPMTTVAQVKIQPPGDLSIMRGSSKTVEVRVERQNFDGRITLALQCSDGSIEATTVDIPSGETRAKIDLKAAVDAMDGQVQATLIATTANPEVKDSLPIRIPLLKQPNPKLAAIEPIILTPGVKKTIDIKLERNGWTGPATISFERLTEGVTCKPTILPSDEDTFHAELMVAADVAEKDWQTRVTGLAGTTKMATPVSLSIQRIGEVFCFKGHTAPVMSVAYAGPQSIVSCGADKSLRMWDLDKRLETKTVALKDMNRWNGTEGMLCLTRDGRWCAFGAAAGGGGVIATGAVQQVQIWDVEAGKEKKRLLGRTGPQRSVTWAAVNDTGRWILCGSLDTYMRLYDVNTIHRDPVEIGLLDKVVEYAAFVPPVVSNGAGGAPLAGQAGGGFAPNGGLPINPPPGAGWANPALAAGKYPHVVYGKQGGGISFWDLANGKELGRCSGHSDRIHCVAFSGDGRWAASASADQSVRIWDLRTLSSVAVLSGHAGEVYAVAFSPDGKRVISGGKDKTVRIWDVAAKREQRKFDKHEDAVTCVAWSPDGRQAISGSFDKTLRLWAVPRQ